MSIFPAPGFTDQSGTEKAGLSAARNPYDNAILIEIQQRLGREQSVVRVRYCLLPVKLLTPCVRTCHHPGLLAHVYGGKWGRIFQRPLGKDGPGVTRIAESKYARRRGPG